MIPACIDAHLQLIDQGRVYQIPGMSPLQPIDPGHFTQNHLQPGLLNDSNCCCLISIVQCLHRLGLSSTLSLPIRMSQINGSPDYATGILAKILSACPSNAPFSLHTFIETWNRSGLGLQLGQNEDLFIVEGILSKLRFRTIASVPYLTKYHATFFCITCQIQYRGITEWANRAFETVPELPLPNQQNPVKPADLMTDLVNERFQVNCQVCQTLVNNASYDIVKGRMTIVRLNRLEYQNQRPVKIMTPLDCGQSNSPGSQFLGELVAIICHRSQPHEHWVSYTKTDHAWYLQNDHRPPTPSSPFNSNFPSETINMLCYRN